MPRKATGIKRKPVTVTLDTDTRTKLEFVASEYGYSLSLFLERAGLWYAKEIEKDPSKLRQPAED